MLKSLYERFCAPSLLLTLRDAEHSESVVVSPAFNNDGLLSGITLELQPPTNSGAPAERAFDADIARDAADGTLDRAFAAAEQEGAREIVADGGPLRPGATEFDPVTGQEMPKHAEAAA